MMFKNSILILFIVCLGKLGISQPKSDSLVKSINSQIAVNSKNINNFKISFWKTTHIVSPEPILYVDISSPFVQGDLPEKNIFRLKPNSNNEEKGQGIGIDENFTVTIVTETFITVYNLSFDRDENKKDNQSLEVAILTIDPSKAVQLNNYDKISKSDYDRLSIRAMANQRSIHNIWNRKNGMEFWMNNIYVIGDLMLFDIGAKNRTKLQYDLSEINFRLADKYAVNASVSQEIEIKPLYSFNLDVDATIEGKWRNFYILRKFTYPVQKTLKIQMSEKQISGRPISISVDYNQILQSKKLLD